MKRMKTFFMYGLWIVLFFIFSTIASDMLIRNSYKNVSEENIHIEQSDNGFEITVDRADSNKQQGYFTGTVKNTSDKVIEKQYVKVDSYYKGKLMQEKYLAFENLQPGEERKFKLIYDVGQIDEFRVSYVDQIPENRTIVDKAIDKVKDFFGNLKNSSIWSDVTDKENEGDFGIPGFKQVHVEGNDAILFFTVLWIWYAIPAGSIWFII